MDKKKYNLPVFGQSNPMGSPMEMEDKKRERVLKAANSPRVKADVYLWMKIISAGCFGFVMLLIFTPAICDWLDGWSPFAASLSTIILCLIIYFYTKHKTK